MRSPVYLLVLAAACGDPEPQPQTSPVDDPVAPEIAPGTRTVPRLTAAEYDATVRDLLGTNDRPGAYFPPDEVEHGFDNIAAALNTTVANIELWETATDGLLDEMFGRVIETRTSQKVQGEGAGVTYLGDGEAYESSGYSIYDGSVSVGLSLPYDGDFEVTVGASGQGMLGEDPELEIKIDGKVVASHTVAKPMGATGKYVAVTRIYPSGVHTFEAALANPGVNGSQTRTLVVDYIEVDGPTNPVTGRSAAYDAFVPCAPDGLPDRACAETATASFGRAAWRRPLAADELAWVMGAYDEAVTLGSDGGEALQQTFKTVMLSPDFLYRLEADPADGAAYRALDGFELASRLAAFLWSSTPDEELLTAAEQGTLTDPTVLSAQVERMISDHRGAALVDNLAAQWFAVRKLDTASPSTEEYPEFDEELRASMKGELTLRLQEFFREGAPLGDLLLSQTAWVDARLATEYGLPYTGAGEFVRTPTVGFDRYGLFGSAGWLIVNARPDSPSAVKRGKWVLEDLLCTPPPPPPPNVESDLVLVETDGSVREQEEAQRSDELCQTCHSMMDPLGFALHSFDGIGMQRDVDEFGFPIDDNTSFEDTTLGGPRDLAEFVAADPRLPTCVVEKTFTYALGRAVEPDDAPMIEAITAEFIDEGQTFSALAKAVVKSEAFRLRGAPEVE
jgi:Protein of unknown function (DUF1592)/Protein of unknown function (DUF1588)/Protein of unknown function (DUF1587)/Protein of unknown function (DUF1585)/Protein of unknown function (DUF1595)/Ca-dependent carbohydrate-binding module xylan-binding